RNDLPGRQIVKILDRQFLYMFKYLVADTLNDLCTRRLQNDLSKICHDRMCQFEDCIYHQKPYDSININITCSQSDVVIQYRHDNERSDQLKGYHQNHQYTAGNKPPFICE